MSISNLRKRAELLLSGIKKDGFCHWKSVSVAGATEVSLSQVQNPHSWWAPEGNCSAWWKRTGQGMAEGAEGLFLCCGHCFTGVDTGAQVQGWAVPSIQCISSDPYKQ